MPHFINVHDDTSVAPTIMSTHDPSNSISDSDIESLLKQSHLPKYRGTANSDLDEFLFKLEASLDHPSIKSIHRQLSTTAENAHFSRNLYKLLCVCLSGEAISPFVHNNKYRNKGVEIFALSTAGLLLLVNHMMKVFLSCVSYVASMTTLKPPELRIPMDPSVGMQWNWTTVSRRLSE
jgi:hypothetical protein